MGLDRNIHLEPFIKIPVQYENLSVEIKTCGKHGENYSDKFCLNRTNKIKYLT